MALLTSADKTNHNNFIVTAYLGVSPYGLPTDTETQKFHHNILIFLPESLVTAALIICHHSVLYIHFASRDKEKFAGIEQAISSLISISLPASPLGSVFHPCLFSCACGGWRLLFYMAQIAYSVLCCISSIYPVTRTAQL